MKANRNKYLPLAALVAFAAAAPAAELTVQEQIDALKTRLQELDSKVRPLQRAETTAGDKGFILAAPDASSSLRIRSLIQVDARAFSDANINNDALVLRRARIGLEGKLNKTTEYQITGEFGKSSAEILDANVTLTYSPEVQVKLGRFKTPVGLEQLQSDAAALFIERSLVSQIAPNRDIGVQVGGDLKNGTVSYAVGLFNGIQDGGNNSSQTDANDGKDVAARVTFQPWVNEENSPLAGLTFGVGGSYGLQDAGTAATYKTDGQQTFFNNAVKANGRVKRFSPQFSYYTGGLSVLGEYISSQADISPAAKRKNTGWQLATGYVLTGEKAAFKGVQPANDFDRASGALGAVELVARFAVLDIDDNYLSTSTLANDSATKATSWAVGVNWYLSRVSRLSLDYTHTKFDLSGNATAPTNAVLLKPEHALLARYQLNF